MVAVLRHYLGTEASSDDLLRFARVGRGAVLAAVEGRGMPARAVAGLSQRVLTCDGLSVVVPADNRAIAIHEAGHAIVAHRFERKAESVSIIPEGKSGGRTLIRFPIIVPV